MCRNNIMVNAGRHGHKNGPMIPARPFDLELDLPLFTLLLIPRFLIRALVWVLRRLIKEIFDHTETMHSRPKVRMTFEASQTMATARMKPRYLKENRCPFHYLGRRRRCQRAQVANVFLRNA